MSGLGWYLARRVVWAAVVCVTAVVLTFFLIHLAPGDPIGILAGERSTPEYQALLRAQLGLDQPLPVQLLRYLERLSRGDLGYSFTYQAPVATVMASRLPPTLLLMGTSLAVAMVVGVWIGVRTAVGRGRPGWSLVTVASLVGYSVPAFWLGQILILLFGVMLGWFPILGMTSRIGATGIAYVADIAWHLVLPALTLGLIEIALISRLTRAAMIEVLAQDYIVAARGKGLAPRRVTYRHALRNALLPVITVFGLELGWLVAGFVVVETVFGWPGLGRLTFDAISARDYPVITGLFILVTSTVVVANLLTDLLYTVVDPRIRYG
ncbi:MAG TPA: ABC transporter permease [Candidatus Limnocylindria bacterium]|nr:ABC transporter permease [Candidatus Limnocylindria bacterium]